MPRGKYPRKPRAKKPTKKMERTTWPNISRSRAIHGKIFDGKFVPPAQAVDAKLSEVERTLIAIVERVSTADVLVQSAARHAIDIVKSLRKELYATL